VDVSCSKNVRFAQRKKALAARVTLDGFSLLGKESTSRLPADYVAVVVAELSISTCVYEAPFK